MVSKAVWVMVIIALVLLVASVAISMANSYQKSLEKPTVDTTDSSSSGQVSLVVDKPAPVAGGA